MSGSGRVIARAPSGTHSAAASDASDVYRNVAAIAIQTRTAGSVGTGTSRSMAPKPVATPFPPRNPRNTDQQLPTTAATAPVAMTVSLPVASAAIVTAR